MISLRKSVIFAFVAKYAETIIFTVHAVVLARLLTPEDIGVYSVAAAAIAVSSGVRDFGLGSYIVQARELTTSILRSVFWIGAMISIAVIAVIVAAAPLVGAFYRDPRVTDIIYILAAGFLIIPFATPISACLRREMDFVTLSKMTVIVGISQTALSIYLATAGFGPYALAWGTIANIALSTLLYFYFRPRFEWLRPDVSQWRSILPFGAFSAASTTVGEVNRNGADLIIGRFTGLEAVALFSRAQGVVDLFNRLFADAIGLVALPAAAQNLRGGGLVPAFYLRTTQLLTGVAWPFFLVLLVVADEVVLIVFGSQWGAAILPAQILCIARFIGTLQAFVPSILTASGAMRSLFRAQVVIMVATVVCIAIGATISLPAIAVAACVAQTISVFVYHAAFNRLAAVSWRQIGVTVRPSLIVAAATFAASVATRLAVNWFEPPLAVGFIVVAGISGVVWLLAIVAVNHPLRVELESLRDMALARRAAGGGK